MHDPHHHGATTPSLAASKRAELIRKDEDLTGANGQIFRDNSKANTMIVADLDAERKAFATLQARYAMAGFSLIELTDGSLLASRWNLSRGLPDALAARQFLRRIGGAAA